MLGQKRPCRLRISLLRLYQPNRNNYNRGKILCQTQYSMLFFFKKIDKIAVYNLYALIKLGINANRLSTIHMLFKTYTIRSNAHPNHLSAYAAAQEITHIAVTPPSFNL
jgi:hypothetical protein